MLELTIPGRTTLRIGHLVLDYNGTIAADGRLAPGVAERIRAAAELVAVHVITADTYGQVAREVSGLPLKLRIIGPGDQAEQKRAFVAELGGEQVVAVGNGANDRTMFEEAALAICVMGAEGAATKSMLASDVTVQSAAGAIDLLLRPGRLAATLRI